MNWKLIAAALIIIRVLFFASVAFFFGRTEGGVGSTGDLSGSSISRVETCVPLTPPQEISTALAYAIPVERCETTWSDSYPILAAEACTPATPPPTIAEASGFVRSDSC